MKTLGLRVAVAALVTANFAFAAGLSPSMQIVVAADLDDDDDDGRPDRELPLGSTLPIDAVTLLRKTVADVSLGGPPECLRFIGSGTPTIVLRPTSSRKLVIQGLQAGIGRLHWGAQNVDIEVVQAWALRDDGTVLDLATSHVSLSRLHPADFVAPRSAPGGDAIRWTIAVPLRHGVPRVDITSSTESGRQIDRLQRVRMETAACPEAVPPQFACFATARLNLVAGEMDRAHRQAQNGALQAEIGGRIGVWYRGVALAAFRVGGPRVAMNGGIGRFRGRLRVFLVKDVPGGRLPIGETSEEAREAVLAQLREVNQLWGQCGVQFGEEGIDEVAFVDPPVGGQRLVLGCGLGLPASGGKLVFQLDDHPFEFTARQGDTPFGAAMRLAAKLEESGYLTTVARFPASETSAHAVAEVSVRYGDGRSAVLRPVEGRSLSSDRTLGVCLGRVDLTDGLSHFSDQSNGQGTLEERTLLQYFDDGDSTTIDVYIVSAFADSPRLGESFIRADGSSLQNTVIIDAEAMSEGASSHVLSHELGHVLLDLAGHPDDFGVDKSSSLMDADASDDSVFGPRRLTLLDCERVYRQSGPQSPVPLVEPWSLFEGRWKSALEHGGGPALFGYSKRGRTIRIDDGNL